MVLVCVVVVCEELVFFFDCNMFKCFFGCVVVDVEVILFGVFC